MDQLVGSFFEKYERATEDSDLSRIGELYAEEFLFAGPTGVRAVKKRDFLNVVPRMKEHFAAAGVHGTRFRSAEARELDTKYLLAKLRWQLTLRRTGDVVRTLDAFATYVLERTRGNRLAIIFQLDHQDLAAVIASAVDNPSAQMNQPTQE